MNYKFSDIAGYEQEKSELKRLCDIINNRELYLKRGAKLPKGIIFYGETGTGKTLFAKVMASTCNLKMINIDLGNLAEENLLLKKIAGAFESARKSDKPAMIFFDEIDKVLPNASEEYYSDHSKAVLAQLLTLIDGMNRNKNFILWLPATTTGIFPILSYVRAESTKRYISARPIISRASKYSDCMQGKRTALLKWVWMNWQSCVTDFHPQRSKR